MHHIFTTIGRFHFSSILPHLCDAIVRIFNIICDFIIYSRLIVVCTQYNTYKPPIDSLLLERPISIFMLGKSRQRARQGKIKREKNISSCVDCFCSVCSCTLFNCETECCSSSHFCLCFPFLSIVHATNCCYFVLFFWFCIFCDAKKKCRLFCYIKYLSTAYK